MPRSARDDQSRPFSEHNVLELTRSGAIVRTRMKLSPDKNPLASAPKGIIRRRKRYGIYHTLIKRRCKMEGSNMN